MKSATARAHGVRIALVALGAGLVAMNPSAPAGAATGQLGFSCSGPGVGGDGSTYAFQAVVDTDLPATLPLGSQRTTSWTTQVIAPETFRSWAQGQGFTTLYSSVRTSTSLDGVAQPLLNESTPGMAVPATAGAWSFSPVVATTQVAATSSGPHSVGFTGLEVTIAFQKGNSNAFASTLTCVLDPATPASATVIDTYSVVAAATTTALEIKGDTATATVTSPGATPVGTVTFSVAGTSVVDEVKGGKASVKLPTLRPGTQTVTASFTPSNAGQWTASSTSATVVVPRIATSTTVSAVHRQSRRTIRAKASVASRDRSTVAGRVTFVLRRNGRIIANKTATLSSRAIARKKFRRVPARGRYVVVAKYVSSDTYLGSRDRVRLG